MGTVRQVGVATGIALVASLAGLVSARGNRTMTRNATPSFLQHYALTNRFRSGKPEGIRATPDGRTLLYLRSGPRDLVRDLYALDVRTGRERLLLSARTLTGEAGEALSVEERARRERQRLIARGFASFELSPDGSLVLLPYSGSLYLLNRRSGKPREIGGGAGFPLDARFSPDGHWVSCVRNGEICLIDVASGAERRLTSGAGGSVTHGLSEFVAQEEMDRHQGYWWSPDSKAIAFQETDTRDVEPLAIYDPVHPETAPQTWPYPRPGRSNARVRLGIISIAGGEPRWVDWDRARFEYLAAVQWTKNSPLSILLQNREQTREQLLAVDPATAATTPLLEEEDAAWLNIDPRMPVWLDDGQGFLWTTERRGRKELELHRKNGSLVAVLGPAGLQEFEHYFPESGQIVVRASAEDPTESHLFRMSLTAPYEAIPVTSDPGVQDVVNGDRGPLCVFTSESPEGEARYGIMNSAGLLARAVPSKAETPGFQPRLEFTTVSPLRLNAVIVRPLDFDRAARYPVIVNVYGGPHSQMVRKQPSLYFLPQWMADQGYVVVSIDGRGTPSHGRDWERAIKGNLIVVPLKDQADALESLFSRYPEMDRSRVGIYGWSFGGYFSALAVTRRPDLFHAAVAGAPVTDWRDYDTHYTERYMGLPAANPDGYDSASVVVQAPDLRRPLLLIHGTSDDNVYFMHSLKLSEALFRAGKTFEFLPLAGSTHMVPDPVVIESLYSRIMQFFETKLAAGAAGEP